MDLYMCLLIRGWGGLSISHLYERKWQKGEELGHPQLKVEAKAVETGPDVNQLTRAQPQGGDGEGAAGRQELLEDLIMIATDIVVNIPAKLQLRRNMTSDQNPHAAGSVVYNSNWNAHLHSQSLMPLSKCLQHKSDV